MSHVIILQGDINSFSRK